MKFKRSLPFANLSPELQEIINNIGADDIFFFEDAEKQTKAAVLMGSKGFIYLSALNQLTIHSFDDGAIGTMMLTSLARWIKHEQGINSKQLIKNMRSLADLLESGKVEEEEKAELEAHRKFMQDGILPPDAVDIDDLNPDLTLKDPPPAPVDSTFELPMASPVDKDNEPK